MYDIKEREEEKDTSIQFNCIADRCYFNKVQNENLMNLKSGYIPKENVLE
ncbi:hypothetical protein [Clostridium ganghwense]|uniref:Uncharacterized protein n=1 Tax=Clostridium ganghwense TaxID=312089 RepID=A0ABT4CU01_9CLOT|nr:hypothetical protein [Clostridium ganghwense]MCY6372546.1 hypothetical protein [Clostridium ganghwense]